MSSTRPGVEITQVITETPAAASPPTLVPCIAGVCRQIVEAYLTDGSLNADAKHSATYNQGALLIPQSAFPNPRDNIDEVNVEEDFIRAFVRYGGRVKELPRGSHGTYGQAFLKAVNTSTRAAFYTAVEPLGGFDFGDDKTFNIAFDQLSTVSTYSTVTFTPTSPATTLTATEVAEAINAVIGTTVATVVGSGAHAGAVLIASPTFGAKSNITVISGSSASTTLGLDPSVGYRVEGAGFRGQDDGDGDLTTPWVEFFRGEYYEDPGTGTFAVAGYDALFGALDQDAVFTNGKAAAVTFSGTSATVPLQVATATRPGDQFWVDGVQYAGTEITKAETSRFRLGKLNSTLSTFSDDGSPTNRVYDTVEVSINSSAALAPKYAYFRADGLRYGYITPEGVAASLAGTTDNALPARPAYVQSSEAVTAAPLNLTGLVLEYTLTEDGVETEGTYTFATGYANVAALAAALAIDGLIASVSPDGGRLVLRTTKTGSDQAIAISPAGTVNGALKFSTTAGTMGTGKDIEFCTQAAIVGSPITPPVTSASGDTFILQVEDSNGVHIIGPVSIDIGGLTTAGDVILAIANAVNGTSESDATPNSHTLYDGGIPIAMISCPDASVTTPSTTILTLATIEGGNSVSAAVSNDAGDFLTDAGFAADPTDSGADGIKGETLEFTLDDVPTTYSVTFEFNSLARAINDINEIVGSALDVATESEGTILLTSQLVGVASMVHVTYSGTVTAGNVFGLTDGADEESVGSGRPNPDFYVDLDGSASVSGVVLRNTATGTPYSVTSSSADLYIQYRGIRLDVTSQAADPSLLSFSNAAEMEAAIGPVSVHNPLALGCYLALQNAQTVSVSAVGIDEANDAAPYGTLDGWMRALDYLEQKEVYTVAALTDDTYIQGLVSAHVQAMSQPENRGERIAFIAPPYTDRDPSTSVMSGQDGASTSNANEFLLDDSPLDELVAAGITGPAISYDEQLYLQVLVTNGGATELRRYSVSNVNNTLLTLRTTFTATQNVDGFFSTVQLTEELVGADYTLLVRGEKLLITGTTLPDLGAIALAAAAEGEAYANRRVYSLFGRSVDVSIDGITQNVPMFYAEACIAGMIAQLNPQQPFTNVPITGLGRVYGTDDTFSENQMDVIADGGRYILVNFGGRVQARHSRSTATTSVEYRELSITKAIDWLTKVLRATNRVYIGKYVISPGFIDQLTLANEGVLRNAKALGVVTGANLTQIAQSETEPDVVLLEVTVQPAYPCNKIKITIVT
jgi:hypothetical protein